MALDPLLPIFGFRPDWGQSISERLAFRTDVNQARSGEAQTSATLIAPRRTFEFSLGVEGRERQWLGAQLWSVGKGEWYLPILTDGLPLASTLTAGDVVITLDVTDRDFVDDGVVIFRGDGARDVEAFDVSISGSTLTLGAASARDWPVGTMVFPGRKARLDESFSSAAFTGGYGSGRIRFVLTEPSDWPAVAPGATYRDFPVLQTRPHTARDPETDYTLSAEVMDDGIGPPSVFDYVGVPLALQDHDWWLKDRAAIAEFRSLVYALHGKRNSIWVPTWLDDLTIAASLGSGSTALRVTWCGYTDNLLDAVNRQDIRIQLTSGAVYYRRITAASEISSTVEELTLSSSLGVAITVADVAQISFMGLCRSETDLFQLEWWTGDFAEVATAWRGRKHDL